MKARTLTDFLGALLGAGGLAKEAEALPKVLGIFLLGLYHYSLPPAEVLVISALHFMIYRADSHYLGFALLGCVLALTVANEKPFLSTLTWVYANLAMKYPHRNASEMYAVAVLVTRTFVSRVTLPSGASLSLLELMVVWVFVLFLVHFQTIMLLITLLSVPALESVLTFNLISFTKDGINTNFHTKFVYMIIILFPFSFLIILLLYLIRYTSLDKDSIQDVGYILVSLYSILLGEEWAIFVLGPLVLLESLRNMGYLKFLFAVKVVGEIAACFELDKPPIAEEGKPINPEKDATYEKNAQIGATGTAQKPPTEKKQATSNPKPLQTDTKTKARQKGLWGTFFSFSWLFEGGSDKRTLRNPGDTSKANTELTKLIAIFWPVFDAYIYKSSGKTRESGTAFYHHLFPLYICGIAHPLVDSHHQSNLIGRLFGSIKNLNGTYLEDTASFLFLTLFFSSSISTCDLNWDRISVPLAMTVVRLTEKKDANLMLSLSLISFYYAYSLSLRYAKPVSPEQ